MPTTPQIKRTYSSGELLPTVGSPEYKQAQELSLVDRYAGTQPAVSNPNENKPYGSGPGSSMPITSDVTRENYRRAAQGSVDAIKSKFDEYIKEDIEAKKKLENKAYLSALLGGRSGSPSGAAEVSKASAQGQKQIEKTRQAMDREIAGILSDADSRASAQFQQEREEYLAQQKDRQAEEQRLSGNIKAQSEKDLEKFASAGLSYDDWAKQVGPKRVEQYMKETGRDENSLKTFFLHSIPKDQLISTTGSENSDGSRSFYKYKYDPQGKIIGVQEVGKVNGTPGKKIKESRLTDSGVQILYTDGTYEEKGRDETTPFGVSNKPVTGAPQGYTEADLQKARNYFASQGTGGFTNPYLYADAFADWIKKGGDRLTFIKYFPPKNYLDPKHNNLKDQEGNLILPLYLRTNLKDPSETEEEESAGSSGGRTY